MKGGIDSEKLGDWSDDDLFDWYHFSVSATEEEKGLTEFCSSLFESKPFLRAQKPQMFLSSWSTSFLNSQKIAHIVDVDQTCKKALKGAKPVPGPIIIIGTEASAGNLKFDCLTKMGAWLHSWVSSCGAEFCRSKYGHNFEEKDVNILRELRLHTFIQVEQTPLWILPVGVGS